MRLNTKFVKQPLVATPVSTTTTNFTTTTCSCTVNGSASSVNVKVDTNSSVKAAVSVPTPPVSLSSCYGSKFVGYKVTVLPTKGSLKLGNADVTVNQILTKADFPQLTYTVDGNTVATDSFSYILVADCGSSSTLTVTFNRVAKA